VWTTWFASAASAQYIFPPTNTFPGEPYNAQPLAPNFFAYVLNGANGGPANISGYSINIPGGGLSPVSGSPFSIGPTDSQPRGLAIDPTGRCAVAVVSVAATTQSFSIDPNNGNLSPYGSPIATGIGPDAVVITPNSRFVYVMDPTTTKIFGFMLGSGDCALDPIPGSPFSGFGIYATVDPNGQWLYLSTGDGGSIEGYSINPTTGALTPIPGSPFAVLGILGNLTITPSDKFLYVSDGIQDKVFGFNINPATGALTLIAGSPFTTGSQPDGIVIHQSGRWLYIANGGSSNVSGFSINPVNGALTPLPGSPFAPAAGAVGTRQLAIDPGGNLLYATNLGSANLSAFNINLASGVLTQNTVSGNTIPTGASPDVIVTIAPAGDLNNLLFNSFLAQ
jgi:6-phosphogluconolactonase (cycloisomerase 2 family)